MSDIAQKHCVVAVSFNKHVFHYPAGTALLRGAVGHAAADAGAVRRHAGEPGVRAGVAPQVPRPAAPADRGGHGRPVLAHAARTHRTGLQRTHFFSF